MRSGWSNAGPLATVDRIHGFRRSDDVNESGVATDRAIWRDNAAGITFAAAWLASLSWVGLIGVMPRPGFFAFGIGVGAAEIFSLNAVVAAAGGAAGGFLTRNGVCRRVWLALVYAVAAVVEYAAFCTAAAFLIPFVRRAVW